MSILIKNGRVIDPASHLDKVVDIYLERGKFSRIGKNLKVSSTKTIDARGKLVFPGLIDMHTHLREPGREDEETIISGSKAAAHGGFTTICCMPNTEPPIDNAATVNYVVEESKRAYVNVLPIATITRGREGKELSEMAELKKCGAVGFSDDGSSVKNALLMRRALEYSLMLDVPLIPHCEDEDLAGGGSMNESYSSTKLGLKGIPPQAEEVVVFRDILLAELTGARIHIAHVSTKESVRHVLEAKKRGVRVSCEVTPHHFTLSEEVACSYDTNTKVNPPLRSPQDIRALKKALQDGTIEVIASDHAPHLSTEKEWEYEQAPFGMIGLETTLPLVMQELVEKKILSLSEAIAKLTINPARILGLNKGKISKGMIADLTIFDPKVKWQLKPEDIVSLSKNTPFLGWNFSGKVTHTIVGGKVVMEEGDFLNR